MQFQGFFISFFKIKLQFRSNSMSSDQASKNITKTFKPIFPNDQILRGGSHTYDEGTRSSDLDFYIIISHPWNVYRNRAHYSSEIAKLKTELQTINLSILIVPKYFFKKGYYYVYGQDETGAIIESKINKKIIYRHSLKFALFYHLEFLRAADDKEKARLLIKTAKQLSAAVLMRQSAKPKSPIFSKENLKTGLEKITNLAYKLLTEILSANPEHISHAELESWGREVAAFLIAEADRKHRYLKFSNANYLIYNIRFITKKDFSFLFHNPDKYIIKKLKEVVLKRDTSDATHAYFKKVIFPALIF